MLRARSLAILEGIRSWWLFTVRLTAQSITCRKKMDRDEEIKRSRTAELSISAAGSATSHRKPIRLHACHSTPKLQRREHIDYQHDQVGIPRLHMDTLGAGIRDPFGALPELPRGDTSMLVYHCKLSRTL